MSKVWGGVKKGAAEASANAAIEARLLRAKQVGFDHPPEVEEQMNVCMCSLSYSLCRSCVLIVTKFLSSRPKSPLSSNTKNVCLFLSSSHCTRSSRRRGPRWTRVYTSVYSTRTTPHLGPNSHYLWRCSSFYWCRPPCLCKTLINFGSQEQVAALEAVREEWKQLEAQDLHQIAKKQDAACRNIVTYRYWESKKEHEVGKLHGETNPLES